MRNYVADFETTSYEQYTKDGYTRVFMYAIANIDTLEVVERGTSIEQFLAWCYTYQGDKSISVYFHNLAFDGSFIVNHLLSIGYKHVKKFGEEPDNEFETLINDMGMWYTIKIRYKKGKGLVNVTFKDSVKKIPLSVRNIAKVYKMRIGKGDFEYNMYRPLGYVPTADEWDYVDRDVLIVARALKQNFDSGMKKMTISSDAYKNFIDRYDKKQQNLYFPYLELDVWEDIRKAYKGGWVYHNQAMSGKVIDNVLSYDVNSLYPYSMYEQLLPYSHPRKFIGKYQYNRLFPLYIQFIEVSFKLKEGYLPTIQTASLGRYTKDLFLTDTENDTVELALTNIDLDLFLKHHEVYYIKYKYGYMFRARRDLFKGYIDDWYHVKETTTGGERQLAKLMLNSLYGKFGTNPKNKDKKPYLNENKALRFNTGEETISRWLKYIPVAVFTTANARKVIIESSQMFYDNHLYSDTDSMKLYNITPEEVAKKIDVDSKRLGAFDLEDEYKQFKMLKPKHYAYTLEGDDHLYIKASGIPDKVKDTITSFDIFSKGFETNDKLIMRQVKGGAVLVPSQHVIK